MNLLIELLKSLPATGLTVDPNITVNQATEAERNAPRQKTAALKATLNLDTRHPLLQAAAQLLHGRRIEITLNANHLQTDSGLPYTDPEHITDFLAPETPARLSQTDSLLAPSSPQTEHVATPAPHLQGWNQEPSATEHPARTAEQQSTPPASDPFLISQQWLQTATYFLQELHSRNAHGCPPPAAPVPDNPQSPQQVNP